MRGWARSAAAALALAGALTSSGCLSFVRSSRPMAPGPSPQPATASHELPTPAPAQASATPAPSARAAIVAFAGAYINWSATTVSADMRALAAVSVGQARSAMQLAAAQTAGDYELRQGGVANRGQVEAVAALSGQPDRYVVVTREQTSAAASSAYQGLAPAWHVTIATVVRQPPGGWAVSGWQPES